MRRLQLVTPFVLGMAMAIPAPAAHAQIGIGLSITIAPPVLPVYVQPPIPSPGYIWTPGYWAYGSDGYYWVPGTWVEPPQVGLLWTPGYWGWNNGVYAWNAGYWGQEVGFYGGVNYGFGYSGDGYFGGRWDHGHFAYNNAVNNFGSVHITNVYNHTVINNDNRVAFNGGDGGLSARATPQQEAFAHQRHVPPTSNQQQQERTAAGNPQLRYAANHGAPPIAATARPNEFSGRGVVAARPVAASAETQPSTATERPGGVPGTARPGTLASHEAIPAERAPGTEARPGAAHVPTAEVGRPATIPPRATEARPNDVGPALGQTHPIETPNARPPVTEAARPATPTPAHEAAPGAKAALGEAHPGVVNSAQHATAPAAPHPAVEASHVAVQPPHPAVQASHPLAAPRPVAEAHPAAEPRRAEAAPRPAAPPRAAPAAHPAEKEQPKG
jgi:hypothetical protein